MIAFRNILVAADFSESSRAAFRVACALARRDQTRVFVLNVMEPKYVPESPVYRNQQTVYFLGIGRDSSEHEALEKHLREIYVPNQPLDVQYRSREGHAAEMILCFAQECGCDLIVMGTHGRHGLTRVLAGSIAETVLRHSRCPVLALRHQEKETPGRGVPIRVILHPTDFSPGSEASLQVARRLALDLGAQLILLHVTPTEIVVEGTMAIVVDSRADRESLEEFRERMEGPDLKCPVDTRLVRGEPAPEILKVAGEVGADLIVMGTQGRTGLSRMLMGSVAEAVLRGARCPVLIGKSPLPSPEAVSRRSAPRSKVVF
jgi:nucleotide-binding universal stress UspA family protein